MASLDKHDSNQAMAGSLAPKKAPTAALAESKFLSLTGLDDQGAVQRRRNIFMRTLIGTIPVFLLATSSCETLEQATLEGGRFVRIGVRLFGPLEGDGTVTEQFCESQLSNFIFQAIPGGTGPTPLQEEEVVTAPNRAERFDPLTEIDDEDPSGVVSVVRAGGCFLWHEPGIFLRREVDGQDVQWGIFATWQPNASDPEPEWAGACTIEIITGESATNRPFVGFDVVDDNFPASIPPQQGGCRYEPLLGTGLTIGHSDF